MKVLDIPADATTIGVVLANLKREIDLHGTVCFTAGKEILFFALSNGRFERSLRERLAEIRSDPSTMSGN